MAATSRPKTKPAACPLCGTVRQVCSYKPADLCRRCHLENQRRVLAHTMRRPYLIPDHRKGHK